MWVGFLGRSTEKGRFTKEQINTLAQIDLNGRQIKNILKTAQFLATSKEKPLSFEHLQVITR